MTRKLEEQYSEQETARRRDAVVKHMSNTPPKPHSEMKIGKAKPTPRKKTVARQRNISERKL